MKLIKNILQTICLICIIFFAVFSFSFLAPKANSTQCVFGENEVGVYAKAKSNCILYKTKDINNNSPSNIYFFVPESYFICVLEQQDNIVKARYSSFVGYVDASFVSIVSFVPKKPYLENVFINIFANSGTQLRTQPIIDNNNVLATMPAGTPNLNYIAKTAGETPVGGVSNVWYYVEYSPEFSPTEVFAGYIYSERTTAPVFESNLEAEPAAPKQDIIGSISADSEYENVEISFVLRIVLIALICLPIITIFLIAIIKQKRFNKSKLEHNCANSSLLNQPAHNSFAENNSKINHTKPIKFFKNKQFIKKPKQKPSLLLNKEFSLEDLDDNDNSL